MHFLKKHLTNKRISSVRVQEDNIVYGKVGTSASAFQAAMTGKTVLDARQQGKYFWLVMNSAPHPVMHLGMTGWIKFQKDDTSFYRPKKDDEEWPPRFWKFILKTEDEAEVAFVDPRRLARIRLVDAEADDLRKTSPLKENGPDPVIDKDILTLDWLSKKMRSKKVPVKALLLDQANISGVGNWVADEILYQARIHPEQYSNTFSDEQLKALHDSLKHVCTTACELLAESDKFPEDWLMKYRWDKGKKGEVNKLPNGAKIVHLKVGGRTSAIVPSVQKKTAAVAGDVSGTSSDDEQAGDVSETAGENGPTKATQRGKKRKKSAKEDDDEGVKDEDEGLTTSTAPKRGRKTKEVKEEETGSNAVRKAEPAKPTKVRKTKEKATEQDADDATIESQADVGAERNTKVKKQAGKGSTSTKAETAKKVTAPTPGTRRSGRLSGNSS